MSALVSVVIPVYNVEQYLNECVDSVLDQTYSDYEIILVDDGSTDNSGKLCDDYLSVDNRIKVIHRENGGLSAARNTGMDAATGDYIYFLDSDDYIESVTLERLVHTAKTDDADIVFFDGYVFYTDCEDDGTTYEYSRHDHYQTDTGRKVLEKLLINEEYRTAVPLTFYNTKYLQKNNIRFYEGILHEDELFTFQTFNADGIVAHCHEELYARRIRPASIMTASSNERRFTSMLAIFNELAEMYRTKRAEGHAADMYLIRTAKAVIARYKLLSDEQQVQFADSYKEFKKSVMRYKGFGDMKLKIKCSGPIMNKIYRGINKYKKD